MAFVALVGTKPMRATKGHIGTCIGPDCRGEMIAKIGSGLIKPHWAHRHAGDCELEGNEESGWHLTWRTLFQLNGCTSEVVYADGKHRADAVTPDGRVVEFQTTWLPWQSIRSREATYQNMAWMYRVTDSQADLDLGDTALDGLAEFHWYTPRRSILAHERPVYWHRSDDAIWSIRTVYRTNDVTDEGAVVWKGVAQLIGTDWADFAERISNGEQFADPPTFHGFEGVEARRAYAAARQLEHHEDAWIDMDGYDCPLTVAPIGIARTLRPGITHDPDKLVHMERYRATCPPCQACTRPMICGQKKRHYTCGGVA